VRLGESAPTAALNAVAADPETRGALFDGLNECKRSDAFPRSELTQEKLAEAEMVHWLAYPTELGQPPDEIELMRTIEEDAGESGGGRYAWFVFRFRVRAPHPSAEDGWLAGVAGPFRKDEFPTTRTWGDTFSTFTRWEEFTADEHLSSIRELMDRWREHHSQPQKLP